ncbi:ABC transporter transmembrane domain-containing protein [Afifella marina]|uniref:Putative ABC transport system ATP-binding protein n=1 Tax=Afifella marina DSM 2698 TaxID=1120955 RepID=A0A1G5MFL2_AFIMA|nr:ABC transporter ATP-binding protein [Afifella marina]SCZ23308.1 putative ABC transport system ATP-binding protein [Afifella marina DSM 2698]
MRRTHTNSPGPDAANTERKARDGGLDRNFFRYIWRYSRRQQLVILAITLVSFPILYVTLELPKTIVNQAIGGKNFPKIVFGREFDQIEYLILLSLGFLLAVGLNGVVKYVMNVYKGLAGERTLRRLRYQLFERVLRFRLPHFSRASSGEIIAMIASEVQPLGGFIADAIAVPIFQGGTLLVYLSFIFMQDPLLGAAAVSLYPFQGWLIPRLQKRVNMLARERVRNLRELSEDVGASIAGIRDIHANNTAAYHLAEFTNRLQRNFDIRYEIFKRKFMIKFINNLMNQITPFFFYSVGGYLVIKGQISFGALVAVLAAYKDLASPWKELLDYYQNFADTQVKYVAVVEQFDPPDLYPVERLHADPELDFSAAQSLVLTHVSYSGEGAGQEVNDVSAEIPLGEKLAVLGSEASGRTQLLMMMAGLLSPSSGRIEIGGYNLEALPQSVLGRRVAYASAHPYILNDTIRFNLVYGLLHRPIAPSDGIDEALLRTRLAEAELTGNASYEYLSSWEDLAEAGVGSVEELDHRIIENIEAFGMSDEVYRLGLQARLPEALGEEARQRILSARNMIAEQVRAAGAKADFVEFWSEDSFNRSATLAENLLFGVPRDPDVTTRELADVPAFREAVREAGLEDALVAAGRDLAAAMVELFSNVSGQSDALANYSFIPMDELPEVAPVLRRAKDGIGRLKPRDRARLLGYALQLVPAKHRLGIVTPELEARVVAARPELVRALRRKAPGAFHFFSRESFNEALTVEQNLLFGHLRADRRKSREQAEAVIADAVERFELRPLILRAGLDFRVGIGGSRLSSLQRVKIGLLRGLMRRPEILVVDDLFKGNGEEGEDARLGKLLQMIEGRTVIVGMTGTALLDQFDHCLRLRGGAILADERPPSRSRPGASGRNEDDPDAVAAE